MPRKKSKRTKRKAAVEKMDKRFSCLVCHREFMVVCVVNHLVGTGAAKCLACPASFKCPVNRLSQPIDVYSEWVDTQEAKWD